MRLRFVFAALIALQLVAPLLAAQSSPEQRDLVETRRILQQWQNDLNRADAALVDGDHAEAIERSTAILRDAENRVISGGPVDQLLGTAFVLRAIGFHQAGELDRASWSWFSALAVWPEASELTMNAYGAAGPWLKALVARGPEEQAAMRRMLEAAAQSRTLEKPEPKHQPVPDFPRGRRLPGGGGGRLGIMAIIGTDGRLRNPVVVSRTGPSTFVSAALEKMEEWRFVPARLDGEPVELAFMASVNFDLRR